MSGPSTPLRAAVGRFHAAMHRPVDIASLVFVRVAFGLVMLWEVWRYFDRGWIERYWIEPEINFTYLGFDWVTPWPGDWMYVHFAVMGVLAAMIVVGLAYRVATTLFFLAFTYTFLLEQARYLNHFYLVCLLSFLLILLPAHRSCSVDAWLGWARRSNTVPFWTLWILQFQLGVVYFYGGIAKLNGDWFRGEPMRMWMEGRGDMPLLGPILDTELTVWVLVVGGVLFDLLIVPLLVWKRTRAFAFLLTVGFHLTNAVIWTIGIFPPMAIALTTVFFEPEWPRRFFRIPTWTEEEPAGERREPGLAPDALRRAATAFVAGWVAVQLLVPLRHHLYPGWVAWTDEGHMFSWRMKLRARGGTTVFHIYDPVTNEAFEVDPEDFLTSWQRDQMDTQPDMILQFVAFLEEEYAGDEGGDLVITADARVSLNGRDRQAFIDPNVDLTEVRRSLAHKPWIMPLVEPLRPARAP